jgi:RIO kinase 1
VSSALLRSASPSPPHPLFTPLSHSLLSRPFNLLTRLEARVNPTYLQRNLDSIDPGIDVSHGVNTVLRDVARKQLNTMERTTDKSERATIEQALDPKTRMVLFKLLNRGVFNEINGCVSTGKEANVYHATDGSGADLAVKVYKTSILVFQDRDRYVSGDYRFRQGYSKGNPRKMVKVWAEKEFRNLMRLNQVRGRSLFLLHS